MWGHDPPDTAANLLQGYVSARLEELRLATQERYAEALLASGDPQAAAARRSAVDEGEDVLPLLQHGVRGELADVGPGGGAVAPS